MDRAVDRGMFTDKYLQRIAEKIGHEWRRLGILLGLSPQELDHLKVENRKLVDCVAKMLAKWRDNGGAQFSITSVKTLMKALEDVSRKDLSESIEKDYNEYALAKKQVPQETTQSVQTLGHLVVVGKDGMDTRDSACIEQDQLTAQFRSIRPNETTGEMDELSRQTSEMAIGPAVIAGGQRIESQGKSGTVTNQVFDKIAKNIGADWHRLGILLGLSHTDLDHLKENYPHSVIDCIMAMLEQWRGDPVTDGSMAVVRTALVDVGRRDLAESIATHDNDNSAENATSRRENDPIRQVSEWVESQSCYTCSDGPSESGYGTRSEISEKTSATETKEGGTDLASEGDCAQSDTSPSDEEETSLFNQFASFASSLASGFFGNHK